MLSSISIYSMGIYKWPASLIKEGERIIRNFFWLGEPDSRKACVVAWDKVCKPYKEGGINLQRLKAINQSLMMKLSWNFLNPTDGWSEFMRAKFISKSGNFSRITKGSSIWVGVRGAIEDVPAHSGWVIGDGAIIDLWGGCSCKYPLVKSCFWELPRIGEIKINTDGAAKGNPSKGGIGYIFRDCNGIVMGTLSKGLGLITNFMAECEAIIHGVEYATSFGWLIAWIESDSTTTVEAFKTNNIPWILVAAWENASRNMRHIRFSVNWREPNFSADTLSKKGALLHEGMSVSEMERPAFLKKIEVPMQEYFRFC
ncbi:hypothetical protein GIB67_038011 [Kingdonia uniflora]|uniref:RNase H type-1 domain-containing protein n=1 Tax=Kingdonia uniflora TaxID=39325 RepID=A0A7J7LHD5_9MAGN|nr:hypothetical protein GIB67_038011 [Kingdonia uniflora]